jgi:DNA-binding transcriptional MerR regulator
MTRIPDDKRYFRIGEASRIVGVEPYVLRYWESAFPQIKPSRADSRQRTYQRKDLEMLLEIKRMLYEERMTIEGAKRRLREGRSAHVFADRPFMVNLKRELETILKTLS